MSSEGMTQIDCAVLHGVTAQLASAGVALLSHKCSSPRTFAMRVRARAGADDTGAAHADEHSEPRDARAMERHAREPRHRRTALGLGLRRERVTGIGPA